MNIALLLNFVRQDLVDRYAGSVLGRAWAFVLPLVQILIFIFVFSTIMGAKLSVLGAELGGYAYSIYLVAGILAWNAFANTVSRTASVYQDKAALIGKVDISLAFLPLHILVTETILFCVSWSFFACFLYSVDALPGASLYWLPLVFLVQQVLAYALGFLAALLGVLLRDVREMVNVGMQLWFWLTPVVYVVTILPEQFRLFFYLNPMVYVMDAYRAIVLYQQPPGWQGLAVVMVLAAACLALALWLYRRMERDIRDLI